MLTNEFFEVSIKIDNTFDLQVENVSLFITVPANLQNKGEIYNFYINHKIVVQSGRLLFI